jgi:hypothetical protein
VIPNGGSLKRRCGSLSTWLAGALVARRQCDALPLGVSPVQDRHVPYRLNDLGSAQARQIVDGLSTPGAVAAADADLQQLVVGERGVELAQHRIGDPGLPHRHHRMQSSPMGLGLEKAYLSSREHVALSLFAADQL